MIVPIKRWVVSFNGHITTYTYRKDALAYLVTRWNNKYADETDDMFPFLEVKYFDHPLGYQVAHRDRPEQVVGVGELCGDWFNAQFDQAHLEGVEVKSVMQAMVEAAYEPDLDKALLPIQDALGVASGDTASVFFSGPDNDEDAWPGLSPTVRMDFLLGYVRQELFDAEYEVALREGKAA